MTTSQLQQANFLVGRDQELMGKEAEAQHSPGKHLCYLSAQQFQQIREMVLLSIQEQRRKIKTELDAI